jgi:hypothetical protein
VGTTYDNVVGLQLERFRFQAFTTKPLAVDEGTIGAFDIFDVNLVDEVILMFPSGDKWAITFPSCSHTSACCLLRTFESK